MQILYPVETSAVTYYVTVGGGILLLVLFSLWIVCLVRILLAGQESRLQKKYGSESDVQKEKKKNRAVVGIIMFGILLAGLTAGYYFFM